MTLLASLLAAGIVAYSYGGVYGWAFLYGAGVGTLSFTSIAVTAALLGGRFTGERILLGLAVYVGRLFLAAGAIGVPIYFGTLPALAMVCGFAGVYVVENVVLLLAAPRSVGSAARGSGGGIERRTGV
jgi:hypothetical protein